MPIPALEKFLQLIHHLPGQLDHRLNIGKHGPFFIIADEILISERFFDMIADGD